MWLTRILRDNGFLSKGEKVFTFAWQPVSLSLCVAGHTKLGLQMREWLADLHFDLA